MARKIKQFCEVGQTGEVGPVSKEHGDGGLMAARYNDVARRIKGQWRLRKAKQNRNGLSELQCGLDCKALHNTKTID